MIDHQPETLTPDQGSKIEVRRRGLPLLREAP